MNKERVVQIQGFAFACILSVLCALAMTRNGITPNTAIFYWLMFIVFSGLSIDPELFDSGGQIMGLCLVPAVTLILTLIFRGALDYIRGAFLLTVASFDKVPANANSIIKIGLLYLVIFVITVPALFVGAFARNIVFQIAETIWNVKTAKFRALEKNIVIGLRIVGLIAGALWAFR